MSFAKIASTFPDRPKTYFTGTVNCDANDASIKRELDAIHTLCKTGKNAKKQTGAQRKITRSPTPGRGNMPPTPDMAFSHDEEIPSSPLDRLGPRDDAELRMSPLRDAEFHFLIDNDLP